MAAPLWPLCILASLRVPTRMAPNCPNSVANRADASDVNRNRLVPAYQDSWTMHGIALYYCICSELMPSWV